MFAQVIEPLGASSGEHIVELNQIFRLACARSLAIEGFELFTDTDGGASHLRYACLQRVERGLRSVEVVRELPNLFRVDGLRDLHSRIERGCAFQHLGPDTLQLVRGMGECLCEWACIKDRSCFGLRHVIFTQGRYEFARVERALERGQGAQALHGRLVHIEVHLARRSCWCTRRRPVPWHAVRRRMRRRLR